MDLGYVKQTNICICNKKQIACSLSRHKDASRMGHFDARRVFYTGCMFIQLFVLLQPLKTQASSMSLKKSRNPEIKENYALYTQLLKEQKHIKEAVITVSERRKNQNNRLAKQTFVEHVNLNDEISFTVEVNVGNYKCFWFILRCTNLSESPFFHYDSSGATHRNYDENSIPLTYQPIKTPHFNHFNENGLSLAYQPKQSGTEDEQIDFCDLSFIKHFCIESNITLKEGEGFPGINIMTGTIPFDTENNDPNKGAQFL